MLFLDLTVRDAQAEVVRTAAINGSLRLKSGSGQLLATIPMGLTPFLPASGGAVALTAPLSGPVILAGTVTYFELLRQNLSLILRGTVGNNAGDIVLSSVVLGTPDVITLNALSYVVPAA